MNEPMNTYEARRALVLALRAKGLVTLTPPLLGRILADEAFARSTYPSIPQSAWHSVIRAIGRLQSRDLSRMLWTRNPEAY